MENQIYFIKEEDNTTKQNALKTFSPSFEVNLINIEEFFNFQNKYIVNLLEQICAVEQQYSLQGGLCIYKNSIDITEEQITEFLE